MIMTGKVNIHTGRLTTWSGTGMPGRKYQITVISKDINKRCNAYRVVPEYIRIYEV